MIGNRLPVQLDGWALESDVDQEQLRKPSFRRSLRGWLLAIIGVVVFCLCGYWVEDTLERINNGFASSPQETSEEPRPSPYDGTTAYYALEDQISDTIAVLPDFPGFVRRSWSSEPCDVGSNEVNPSYVSVYVKYIYSERDAENAALHNEFMDILHDHWSDLGYEIERDESDRLQAQRGDGISLRYSASHAYLSVGVECVVDHYRAPDIEPQGGVVED